MNPQTQAKFDRLLQQFADIDSALVAFSGGVDSTLVAFAARQALGRDRAIAVTAQSPSVPSADLAAVARIAAEIDIPHEFVATHEIDDPNYNANPSNRCYFCKSELYSQLAPRAAARGHAVIVNGTNKDDLGDYRPGLQAADEKQVRAPLADANLSKADVREIARAVGLSVAEKPAAPCLASRIPYGESVTIEKMEMIDQAESFLRNLGFAECRVRHHGTLARIEVPIDRLDEITDPALREQIDAAIRDIGYKFVTIDLRGLRSGSLNEVILGSGFRKPHTDRRESTTPANRAAPTQV